MKYQLNRARRAWCRSDCGFKSGSGLTAVTGVIVLILTYIAEIGERVSGLMDKTEKVVVAMTELDYKVLSVVVVTAVVCRAWTRSDERESRQLSP